MKIIHDGTECTWTNEDMLNMEFLIKELGEDFVVPRNDKEIPEKHRERFFGCGHWPKEPDYNNFSLKSWGEHLREKNRERRQMFGDD